MVADAWGAVSPRLLLLGVTLLAALVFLPTLAFDFVYDDHWILAANGFLREPDLSLLLSPEGAARHVPDAFRPTSVVFDVASYRALAMSAVGQHAVSVVLHAIVVALVATWLGALGAPVPLRIASAGVFAVLAIHAEAVAVVSYREDLLAAAFGLGALVLAEHAVAQRSVLRIAAAGGCMALACGAKMSAAPLPFLFMLTRWLSPWSRARRWEPWVLATAVVLFAGVGLAMAQTHAVYGSATAFVADDPRLMLPRAGMAATMAASVTNHLDVLRLLVLPTSLSPEYVDAPGSWLSAQTLLAAAAIASLLVWGLGCAGPWRRPVIALAILGTVLLAVPTSGLAAMPNLRADRFAYLPSVPACVGIAVGLLAGGRALARRWPERGRVLSLAPLVGFIVLQGGFAQAAANTYRSDSRLWTIALRRAPHSARAHAIEGELLARRAARQERPDPRLLAQARAHCAIALARDDGTALPWLCDARLAAVERDWPRAYRRFSGALSRTVQGRDRVLVALASVALDLPGRTQSERIEHSVRTLSEATREYPYSSEVFAVAGRIFHRLGMVGPAEAHYTRASSLRPERWDLVVAGLELQLDLGHPSAARLTWELHGAGIQTGVDPSSYKATQRRLQDAERLFGP